MLPKQVGGQYAKKPEHGCYGLTKKRENTWMCCNLLQWNLQYKHLPKASQTIRVKYRGILVQSQQYFKKKSTMELPEQYAKSVNIKVNNKDTRAMSFEHIWIYEFEKIWTHFAYFFGVFIFDFEQVIVGWAKPKSSFKIEKLN